MYQYQVFTRVWHFLNALFFLVLIITGISMQYSNPDSPFISFELAMQLHNICGIGLSLNYLVFFIGNWISGNSRHYRIEWKGEKERLMKQARYYLSGYFKKENPPFPMTEDRKFNPLQALTYAIAMYAGLPVLIITGWGLLFPETVLDRVFGVSGLLITDLLHVISGFLLSVFMFIHIYLCTLGANPKDNFRSIITGWHHRGSH
jgi:thiosulfate reductase cytochrome b subunit